MPLSLVTSGSSRQLFESYNLPNGPGTTPFGQPLTNTLLMDPKRIDIPNTATTYYGYANSAALDDDQAWMIKRTSVSGTVTTNTYSYGVRDYIAVWTNRASIPYS